MRSTQALFGSLLPKKVKPPKLSAIRYRSPCSSKKPPKPAVAGQSGCCVEHAEHEVVDELRAIVGVGPVQEELAVRAAHEAAPIFAAPALATQGAEVVLAGDGHAGWIELDQRVLRAVDRVGVLGVDEEKVAEEIDAAALQAQPRFGDELVALQPKALDLECLAIGDIQLVLEAESVAESGELRRVR
jgi:hypothetical protein